MLGAIGFGANASARARGWDTPVEFVYTNPGYGSRRTVGWKATRDGTQYGYWIHLESRDIDELSTKVVALTEQAADTLRKLQELD